MRTYADRAHESLTRTHESYLDNPDTRAIVEALGVDHWTGWALIDCVVRDDLPDGPHGRNARQEFGWFQAYCALHRITQLQGAYHKSDRCGMFVAWVRRMHPFVDPYIPERQEYNDGTPPLVQVLPPTRQ